MTSHSISHGIRTLVRRPGLAGIIYGMNVIIGLLVAVILMQTLDEAVARTGFSAVLVEKFDLALWGDIFGESRGGLRAFIMQFLWIIPLYLLWKVAASVGIIHAVSRGGDRSFWEGVGRHTLRALVLALLFLAPVVVLLIAAAILGVIVSSVVGGEVGTFWAWWVSVPALLIIGLAIVDMMHDFARTELVIGRRPIIESWLAGLIWPARYPRANLVYATWLLIGTVVLAAAWMLEFSLGGIWTAFLVQQILMFARSTVTVGWISSEVKFFEFVESARTPVLADADVERGVTPPGV